MSDFPPLEKPCDAERCKGAGWYEWPHANGHMVTIKCGDCDGTGVVPTEFGQAVLDFIESRVRYEITRR